MKKSIIYIVVILILSVISFFIYDTIDKKNIETQEKDKNKKNIKIPVEITTVKKGNIEAYYTTTGIIEAEKEGNIVDKSSGIVTDIFF